MISWETFVWPLLGILASAFAGLVYAAWRDFGARRSVAAVAAGRRVAVPMTLDAGGVVRGHGVRDGMDIRVLAKKHHLVVDREEFRTSTTRRGRFDDELFEYAELVGLVDDAGRRYYVGPPEEWAPAFRATLEAPDRSAGGLWRLWAGTPRIALGVATAALVLGGVFQGIWWTGHNVSADMLRVVAGQDGTTCAVQWRDGDRREYAELDCFEPVPQAGDVVRIRALAWPFDESALDYEGVFEFLTLVPGAIGAVGLIGAEGLGVRRLRRPAIRLRAAAREGQAGGELPPTAEQAKGMPFRRLAAAVAEREGWSEDVAAEPPTPHWWDPVVMALGGARWLPVVGLLGVAWLPESLSQQLRLALTAGAGVALMWALWRSVTTFLAVRRPFSQPVTSEWDYQLVRTEDEVWVVLLLLRDTPHWAMFLPGGETHPAAAGRCGVRGDLEEGGAVHVRILDRFWVPSSPVIRVTEDFREEMRDDLVSRLVGDLAVGEGDVPESVVIDPAGKGRGGPRDPALDDFREGIAVLRQDGVVVGYVATIVESMWAPFRRQERVWLLVTWADGRRERIDEDYEPWIAVKELREGHFRWDSHQGEVDYTAEWLRGDERDRLWQAYGIHDDVGAYMSTEESPRRQ